ncbi:MAG TPA: SDR family oxidoreductase [Pirellulaceae bacterium]|nr:SDR family oxidoreductase [Pirellulaceae bacterium]
MATCLVTGGAGFIGSHLVEALVAEGHRVRVLDDLSTGFAKNLASVQSEVEFVEGSVLDGNLVRSMTEDADWVFHQAAMASVPKSVDRPLDSHAATATGALTVLDAARRSGVKRVVFAGSSSCYGNQPFAANRESDLPAPLSPYAAAKLAGEYYCRAFHETYGLQTVVLRYFNVFGPRQDPSGPYAAVIPIFIERMLAGQAPKINGDGLQSRDFTYVANVVQGNLLAAKGSFPTGTFNLASGNSYSLLDLVAAINEFLGTDVEPVFGPVRAGDVKFSQADITLARSVLGFEPCVAFRDGLERTIESFRAACTAGA